MWTRLNAKQPKSRKITVSDDSNIDDLLTSMSQFLDDMPEDSHAKLKPHAAQCCTIRRVVKLCPSGK